MHTGRAHDRMGHTTISAASKSGEDRDSGRTREESRETMTSNGEDTGEPPERLGADGGTDVVRDLLLSLATNIDTIASMFALPGTRRRDRRPSRRHRPRRPVECRSPRPRPEGWSGRCPGPDRRLPCRGIGRDRDAAGELGIAGRLPDPR